MEKKLIYTTSCYRDMVQKIWMTLRLIVFLFFVSLIQVSASVYAQNTKSTGENSQQTEHIIKGRVTDQSGTSIPGASVVVKGTTTGVSTDSDGNFSIVLPTGAKSLIISFVGMKSQEIALGNKTTLKVVLNEDVVALDEVVAIGYGTVRKSDLTGSVAKIKFEDVGQTTNGTIEQMLQGKMAGVQITQNSGAPGEGVTFLVRGANSLSGTNSPLVVLDGYPVETGNVATNIGNGNEFMSGSPMGNALSRINPNEIESVEILKDASATAIYGSRGANGVVLITTKRGKAGKEHIEYNFRTDFSSLDHHLSVLRAGDYYNYINEGYINTDKPAPYSGTAYTGVASATTLNRLNQDVDWQNEIFQTAVSQDHQVIISGGNDDLKYAIIGGYTKMEGIVKYASQFERGSIRVNLDRKVGKRLTLGTNISGSMTTNHAIPQSPLNGNIAASAILGAIFSEPIDTPYNADGTININYSGNPVQVLQKNVDITLSRSIVLNAFADYKITKDLKFRVNGGTNYNNSIRDFYAPRGTYLGDQMQGGAYQGNVNQQNYLVESTLNYSKTLATKHRIDAVAGYTYQKWQNRQLGIQANKFANDNLLFYNLGSANTLNSPRTSFQEYALASVLGRVNYVYDNRYMITFTGRNDGSTRLAEGHKWSFFPSAALGWNIHNEKFMAGIKPVISELKVRASVGNSGNQSIGVGQTQSFLSTTISMVNGAQTTGYMPGNMANPLLGWETTKQYNLGLNIVLFKGKYTFAFDYYKKLTTDLLLNAPVPLSTGYATYAMNSGEIENKGYEFEAGARLLTKALKWNVSANVSINRNKILDLGMSTSITGPTFNAGGNNNQPWNKSIVGHPIGTTFGYVFDGIYQTQKEIDNSPYDASAKAEPGLWKFKDISGPNGVPDGLITSADQTIISDPYPKFTYGVTNDFSYKAFSLSFLIMGCQGNQITNINNAVLTGMDVATYPQNIIYKAYNNRWTGPGTSNSYAKPNYRGIPFYGRVNSSLVEDGSFIRLKNITISYALPVKRLNLIQSAKVFVTGTNLITITKYSGFDPEVNSRGQFNALATGMDYGTIPQVRSYSMGLNVSF